MGCLVGIFSTIFRGRVAPSILPNHPLRLYGAASAFNIDTVHLATVVYPVGPPAVETC